VGVAGAAAGGALVPGALHALHALVFTRNPETINRTLKTRTLKPFVGRGPVAFRESQGTVGPIWRAE
jgi:hypothetical protein